MESNQKYHRNRCSILEEKGIKECRNNTIVVHYISKNITFKETNNLLNKQVGQSIAMYNVEKMKVEEMEVYLQSIEKDHKEVLREGDDKTQTLKQDSHQKSMKVYYTQKTLKCIN